MLKPKACPGIDTAKVPGCSSYSADMPPNLQEFMLKHWNSNARKQPRVLPNAASFRRRRERLSQRFPGELLVIPAGHRKVRANDTYYAFRPGTDFYYLTGVFDPDCVLVLLPTDKTHEHLLFVEPNPGKANATFFTDRKKGELWEGPRLGVAESETRYAVTCKPLADLHSALAAATAMPAVRVRVLRGLSASTESMLGAQSNPPTEHDNELGTFLSEMRLTKDADEIKSLPLTPPGAASKM